MNNKKKLLELASKKASDDSNFMAFFLKKYMEFEKVTEQDMQLNLKCSSENYYKLALCKIPNANTNDFIDRLNRISNYANASVFELNKIIKRVNSLLLFSDDKSNSYLMAARDQYNKKNKKDGEEGLDANN